MQPLSRAAHSTLQSLRNDLEETIICPLCLCYYENPKQLPKCGHSFCSNCILQRTINVKTRQGKREIECPNCHEHNTIPGARSLPTNLNYLEVVNIIKALQFQALGNYAIGGAIDFCHHKGVPQQLCIHCQLRYCKTCRQSHIKRLRREVSLISKEMVTRTNAILDLKKVDEKEKEITTLTELDDMLKACWDTSL